MDQMAGEQRNKLNLYTTAGMSFDKAIPLLIDPDGDWNSIQALMPNSMTRAALNDLRAGVSDILRAETGANKTDSEIDEMANWYIPSITDGDTTAQAKLNRLWRKVSTGHKSMTAGYRDIPDALLLPQKNLFWNTSENAQQVQAVTDELDLQEDYFMAIKAAEEERKRQEELAGQQQDY